MKTITKTITEAIQDAFLELLRTVYRPAKRVTLGSRAAAKLWDETAEDIGVDREYGDPSTEQKVAEIHGTTVVVCGGKLAVLVDRSAYPDLVIVS